MQAKKNIKVATNKHYTDTIKQLQNNPKGNWKSTNKIIGNKPIQNNGSLNPNIEIIIAEDKQLIVIELNIFFGR